MKKLVSLTAMVSLLLGLPAALAQSGTRVRVIGQRVNIRAQSDLNSEVIGQLAEGDVVTARAFEGEWAEIVPPADVDLWVHRDFIRDNRVTANSLHVRGGPGINYSVVGMLDRGEEIVRRGEFGEWLKIAPPPNSSLWVSREYVDVLQPEKPAAQRVRAVVEQPITPVREPVMRRPVTRASSAGTVQAVRTAEPEQSEPEVPEDIRRKLIPLAGQGKHVQREGVMRVAGFVFGRPSRYRLVHQDGNRIRTICYIRGNSRQLGSFVGDRLLIRGREYWIRGVRDPVVIPEQIVPQAAP